MDFIRRFFGLPAVAWVRLVSGALSVCLLVSACVTTRTVTGAEMERVAQLVRTGDHVKCVLHDGTKVSFQVTRVEPGLLVGAERQVAVKDVARIEVQRFSAGKTALMIVCVAALGAAGATLSDFAVFPTIAFP